MHQTILNRVLNEKLYIHDKNIPLAITRVVLVSLALAQKVYFVSFAFFQKEKGMCVCARIHTYIKIQSILISYSMIFILYGFTQKHTYVLSLEL